MNGFTAISNFAPSLLNGMTKVRQLFKLYKLFLKNKNKFLPEEFENPSYDQQ